MALSSCARKLIISFCCSFIFCTSVRSQGVTNQFSFGDYLTIPLRVHLLNAKDAPSIHTSLTGADITRILGKLNLVWAQAGVLFYLESLVEEAANEPQIHAQPALHGDRDGLLGLRPGISMGTNMFHVYYVKQMPMNGIYFPEAIFVKDTASLRAVPGGLDEPLPRVTSHELGHALNLPHRQHTTNLMASGTTGKWLNEEEIHHARAAALKLNWVSQAPDMLQKANTLFDKNSTNAASALYSALATIPLQDPQVEIAKARRYQAQPPKN
jgi:hypothetical protein